VREEHAGAGCLAGAAGERTHRGRTHRARGHGPGRALPARAPAHPVGATRAGAPELHECARSRLQDRGPDLGGDPRAPADRRRRGAPRGRGAARSRRGASRAARPLSARAERGHPAARGDRDGARARPGAPGRRRADHRARRDRPGPDPPSAARTPARSRDGHAPDHPRHGGGGRELRPGRGHVRGPGGGAGRGGTDVCVPAAPVYHGASQRLPGPARRGGGADLHSGSPPSAIAPLPGCRFADRCPFVLDRCRTTDPPLVEGAPGHWTACLRWREAEDLRVLARAGATWRAA
jgi:oligopeptide/dipeptide ABC transporter ATP-binding protein